MVKTFGHAIKPKVTIYGIQGGVGSFNEEAIMFYINEQNIKDFEIKYLYTTERVLKALNDGEIDYGIFALHNSVGGVVEESVRAMGKYTFDVYCDVLIPIQHHIMKRKDVEFKNIHTVMAHPQVFAQCKETLKLKYTDLKKVSGEGDLIDTSLVAKHLAEGNIDKNTAVMGPKILSEIYDFDIVESNLQDMQNNLTSFLMVRKL